MSYLILARKYRPGRFSDLTGQETTAKILQAAIEKNRVAHAYLFSGPRGTGKTTTARIFAKALNCREPRNSEPCNACSSCAEIDRSSSIDVLELDAASHTKVEETREAVIDTVAYSPVRDRNKVFIIDEVHMLSSHSFNALLKTLEEPPPRVVFILATTEFHKIPATISSRCQRFRFLPLTRAQIFSTLKRVAQAEKIPVPDDALSLLARAAQGSMRDALSLFDQAISHASREGGEGTDLALGTVEDVLGLVREDTLAEIANKIADKDAKGVLELAGRLQREGQDLSYFLRELREGFREMLIEKCGYRDPDDFDAGNAVKRDLPAGRFTLEELLRATQVLCKCADQMRWNDNPRLVLESFLVRLCQDTLSVEDVLSRLEEAGGAASPKVSPGTIASPAPVPVRPAPRTEPGEAEKPSGQTLPEPREKPKISGNAPGPFPNAWKGVLEAAQSSKPSLLPALQTAAPSWSEGKVELAFPKRFWLDSARRNQSFIEAELGRILDRKIGLEFKLSETPPASSGQSEPAGTAAADATEPEPSDESGTDGDDTVVVEPLSAVRESYDSEEVFEPLGSSPSALEDAVEDEGLKKFLTHFHGKVTRHSSQSG